MLEYNIDNDFASVFRVNQPRNNLVVMRRTNLGWNLGFDNITAAELREIADKLDELNKEKQ